MKTINEIGNKYGKLTVIAQAPSKDGRARWKCRCECGNEIIVLGKSLRSGNTTSCGCSRGKEEIGKKYGMLTILSRDCTKERTHGIYWRCQCDCGKTTSVRGDLLRSGKTTSCGCKTKPNLINQKFGDLTVISLNKTENGIRYWNCKCSCGNIRILPSSYLLENIATHCGCKTIISKGEEYIKKWLSDNNFLFLQQYKFKDCKNKLELPFDFAVLNKDLSVLCLIEFQGEQHFRPVEYFGGEKAYLTLSQNDKIKKDYCNNKNIKLFIINYYDNLEEKLREIRKYLKNY